MKLFLVSINFFLFGFALFCFANGIQKPKIVGLIQVRNEASIIECNLRAFTCYVDALVILDDASNDATLTIIKKLSTELPIERIIENKQSAWQTGKEIDNRQKLLEEGRNIGGTHFVMLDADEILSACCSKNNWLRNKVLSLGRGQILKNCMANCWDGVDFYRNDERCNPFQRRWQIPIAFCDDGICNYYVGNSGSGGPANVLHVTRYPINLQCSEKNQFIFNTDLQYALLHFKYANLENIYLSKAWYMMLELIRAQKKRKKCHRGKAKTIAEYYDLYEYECLKANNADMVLEPVDPAWLDYSFFNQDALTSYNISKAQEVFKWLKRRRLLYFKYLPIDFNRIKRSLVQYRGQSQ